MARRYKLFLVVLAVIVAFDQLTKVWARGALGGHGHAGMQVAGDWFVFRLACNTGVAFGMFAKIGGARVLLSIVGLLAVAAILLYLRRASDRQTWVVAALALVGGGAIGNVVDRVLAGCVTDFVVWRYGTHEWPAFNVADAALVVGVAILFLDAGRQKKQDQAAGAGKGEGAGGSPKKSGGRRR